MLCPITTGLTYPCPLPCLAPRLPLPPAALQRPGALVLHLLPGPPTEAAAEPPSPQGRATSSPTVSPAAGHPAVTAAAAAAAAEGAACASTPPTRPPPPPPPPLRAFAPLATLPLLVLPTAAAAAEVRQLYDRVLDEQVGGWTSSGLRAALVGSAHAVPVERPAAASLVQPADSAGTCSSSSSSSSSRVGDMSSSTLLAAVCELLERNGLTDLTYDMGATVGVSAGPRAGSCRSSSSSSSDGGADRADSEGGPGLSAVHEAVLMFLAAHRLGSCMQASMDALRAAGVLPQPAAAAGGAGRAERWASVPVEGAAAGGLAAAELGGAGVEARGALAQYCGAGSATGSGRRQALLPEAAAAAAVAIGTAAVRDTSSHGPAAQLEATGRGGDGSLGGSARGAGNAGSHAARTQARQSLTMRAVWWWLCVLLRGFFPDSLEDLYQQYKAAACRTLDYWSLWLAFGIRFAAFGRTAQEVVSTAVASGAPAVRGGGRNGTAVGADEAAGPAAMGAPGAGDAAQQQQQQLQVLLPQLWSHLVFLVSGAVPLVLGYRAMRSVR